MAFGMIFYVSFKMRGFLRIDIQRIIQNSNSYFKLFLEVPTMYNLFTEWKKNLSVVTDATHDAVINNLPDLRNRVLPEMLMDIDEWEDKLALNPGTLTEPMRQILDAYFEGLIGPLNLPSQEHMNLITSSEPDEYRSREAINRKRAITEEIGLIQAHQSNLEAVAKKLENHNRAKKANEAEETVGNLLELLVQSTRQVVIPLIAEAKENSEQHILPITHTIDSLSSLQDELGNIDIEKLHEVLNECYNATTF